MLTNSQHNFAIFSITLYDRYQPCLSQNLTALLTYKEIKWQLFYGTTLEMVTIHFSDDSI